MNDKINLEYFKKEKKAVSYVLDKVEKLNFQTICSRLGTNCNKEINNFVNEFNLKHKEVLSAKRIN